MKGQELGAPNGPGYGKVTAMAVAVMDMAVKEAAVGSQGPYQFVGEWTQASAAKRKSQEVQRDRCPRCPLD